MNERGVESSIRMKDVDGHVRSVCRTEYYTLTCRCGVHFEGFPFIPSSNVLPVYRVGLLLSTGCRGEDKTYIVCRFGARACGNKRPYSGNPASNAYSARTFMYARQISYLWTVVRARMPFREIAGCVWRFRILSALMSGCVP